MTHGLDPACRAISSGLWGSLRGQEFRERGRLHHPTKIWDPVRDMFPQQRVSNSCVNPCGFLILLTLAVHIFCLRRWVVQGWLLRSLVSLISSSLSLRFRWGWNLLWTGSLALLKQNILFLITYGIKHWLTTILCTSGVKLLHQVPVSYKIQKTEFGHLLN